MIPEVAWPAGLEVALQAGKHLLGHFLLKHDGGLIRFRLEE